MYIAKERVLVDKHGKCVKADDPSGVQILAGYKGAQVSDKVIDKVKGADEFFDADILSAHRKVSTSKRVVSEPEPAKTKAATVLHSHPLHPHKK